MATRVLIASTNPGKLREFRALLNGLTPELEVIGPAEVGLELDIAETGDTFEANARLKATTYARVSGLPALADDSGLEVDALAGFPGPASARWVPGSDADRVQALLDRLAGIPDARRRARFRAVAALARPGGRVVTAAGIVAGRIAHAPRGHGGFGYDPIFLVEDGGYHGEVTQAELPASEKNRLSHRARAIAALLPDLLELARRREPTTPPRQPPPPTP
jgi:XTP/dITP diphosphohydrolase